MSLTFRTAVAVTLTVLAALSAAPDAAADAPHVVVRLYDTASGDTSSRAGAMGVASRILDSAGITVDWRDCSRDGNDHPCRTVRSARDLVVRIMPVYVPKPGRQPALMAVDASAAPDLQLGFAAVDPTACTGVMATIYNDRVRTVTRRASADYSQVLGRAIAHEIGHLLLCVPGHSQTGLMRAVWTDTELGQNRHDDWAFTLPQQRQLQAGFLPGRTPEHTQARATFSTTQP